MRNCPKCNVRVLDDDAKFCIECGSSLELQLKFFPDDNTAEKSESKLTSAERNRLFESAIKNDADAIGKTFELAQAGDAEAMYFAFLIELDRNNLSAAKDWLLKSAEGNYIDAMCRLADSAIYGTEDFDFPAEEAFKLYEKIIALDENDFRAADGLAVAYLYGRGIKRDFSKAIHWFEKAAALGYIPALLSVGDMYCYGNGVTQDKVKALDYYLQADVILSKTDKPNLYRVLAPVPYYIADLKFKIAGMYRRNDGVPVNLELSDDFYRQAFDIYDSFLKMKIDLPLAFITVLKSDCCFKTGMMYYNGLGVERNYWMAINRFQEALEQGNSYADIILKAENGDPEKMLELSKLYISGAESEGIEKDLSKAERWAKKAREILGEPEEKTSPSSPSQSAPPPVKKESVNIKQVINELYEKYGSVSGIYFYGKSDKAMRKINNAVEAYAQSAAHENIILVFDDTTFGSARDGFLITDKMFYCHNIGAEQQSVLLDDIKDIDKLKYKGMRFLKITSKNSSDIFAEMTNSTESSAEKILDLVEDIVDIFEKPADAEEYINRGINYANNLQNEKAVQSYNKAVALNPNNFVAYRRRAMSYLFLSRYQEAVADFDKALELNPNDFEAYDYRGCIYMYNLKRFERALQDFDKAIEINPNYDNAYNNRGECHRALGDETKAQADFAKAKELGYKG